MEFGIIDKLIEAAGLYPEKTAFAECGGAGLTFAELESRARNIAFALCSSGASPIRPVAILAGRTTGCIAALFGAIWSGRWYVIIDSELPPDRINNMLAAADPSAIITDLPVTAPFDVPVLTLSGNYAEADSDFRPVMRRGDLPMFGIFTSGSTGRPKLVVKSADAMLSFIDVYCRTFGFDGSEIFGNQIPFFFDASTKDIFSTVWLGATCVLLPQSAFAFPINLISLLNEYRISTIVWVPSALAAAAKFDVFSAAKPEFLKNVLFVGERMPIKYLTAWKNALPACRFVNLYGSTEVAGNSCYYVVEEGFEQKEILPIGIPFEGTRVFILDPQTGVPADEGEICIAGPGLAEGYLGEADKTSEVFRDLSIGNFTGRVYFSGDYGCLGDDGNYICISRRDSQIKHMGHRIELGEIEAKAGELGFVNEVCCRYDAENEKIVLFYSADADCGRDIRRALCSVLPKYEIPHKFVYMPALPHNRNGKIDRAALNKMIY